MIQPIQQLIEQFNNACTTGDLDSLAALLHDDVIFVAPDLKSQIIGKKKCMQTIKEYNLNATTTFYDIQNQDIKVWKTTAVIQLEYAIEYIMNEQSYKERGTEFWTLELDRSNNWEMVWRVMAKNERL